MKTFNVIAFGSYLPAVSSKQRTLLTDALLRLSTAARKNGSFIKVSVAENDQATPLILRTCKALSIECEVKAGDVIRSETQDVDNTFLLILRVRAGSINSDEVREKVDTLDEYVNRIFTALSPACQFKDLITFVKDADLEQGGRSLHLDDFKPSHQHYNRTGSYSDLNGYIDQWFAGVRKEAPDKYHDLDKAPPSSDAVNTKMAADPSLS